MYLFYTMTECSVYTHFLSEKRLLKITFMPRVEQTKSMIALSWLLWKYMATNNSISPKEAETPDVLSKQERHCEFSRRRRIRALWTEWTHTAFSPLKVRLLFDHPAEPHHHQLLLLWCAAETTQQRLWARQQEESSLAALPLVLKDLFILTLHVWAICLHVYICTMSCLVSLDSLELELQWFRATMWMLRTEPRSPARAPSVINHWDISPVLKLFFLGVLFLLYFQISTQINGLLNWTINYNWNMRQF